MWKWLLLFAVLSLWQCRPENTFPAAEPVNLSGLDMLSAVNELRSSGCYCGDQYFPPVSLLSENDRLDAAARAHAADMEANNFLNHRGSDGSEVGERAAREGYDWRHIGENIAQGYRTTESVMQAWLSSSSHCRNLMNPNFRELGFARQGEFQVQVFGRRR